VHSGYAHYRRDLLRRGVELYELRPTSESVVQAQEKGLFGSSGASLHAKTFVFDRRTVFVGSFNLSPRSVSLNTEIGLLVESEELAADVLEAFERITRPELSWRLALTGEGGGESIVWLGEEHGEPVRLLDEPGSTWQRRMQVSFLSLLPIETQL
jgi:putative cardiolipin synthase